MAENKNILKQLKKLLLIKEELHPLLFDNNGIMFEEKRKKFLELTDFIIKKSLRTIKDYEIEDIILVGSSASYFYSIWSDFDVKIILNLDRNKAVGTNFSKFLKVLNNSFYCVSTRFRVDKRFVDLKFGHDENYVMGNYSILHNKWNIHPRNDFDMSEITPKRLIKMFYNIQALAYEKFSEIKSDNGIFSFEEIEKAKRLYSYYLSADEKVRADVDKGLADFLTFKLIRKMKYLNNVVDFERQTTNDALSLREEKRP